MHYFWLIILANIVSTDFCMHLYTHQFRLSCVCMLLVPYFLLNLCDLAELLKPSLRNFAITHLILGLHYCALVTFPIYCFTSYCETNYD